MEQEHTGGARELAETACLEALSGCESVGGVNDIRDEGGGVVAAAGGVAPVLL